jgi:hypothetical protein
LFPIRSKSNNQFIDSTTGDASRLQAKININNNNKLQKEGGIIYRTSVFTKEEMKIISDEVQGWSSKLQKESKLSIAQNRYGAKIPLDSTIYSVLVKYYNYYNKLHRYQQHIMIIMIQQKQQQQQQNPVRIGKLVRILDLNYVVMNVLGHV